MNSYHIQYRTVLQSSVMSELNWTKPKVTDEWRKIREALVRFRDTEN